MSDMWLLFAQIAVLFILSKTVANKKLWDKLMDKFIEGWREPRSKFEAKAQMASLGISVTVRTSVPGFLGIMLSASMIFLILDYVLINSGFDYMIIACAILIIIVIGHIKIPSPQPKLSGEEMKAAGNLLKGMDISKLFGGKDDGGTGNDREPDS